MRACEIGDFKETDADVVSRRVSAVLHRHGLQFPLVSQQPDVRLQVCSTYSPEVIFTVIQNCSNIPKQTCTIRLSVKLICSVDRSTHSLVVRCLHPVSALLHNKELGDVPKKLNLWIFHSKIQFLNQINFCSPCFNFLKQRLQNNAAGVLRASNKEKH